MLNSDFKPMLAATLEDGAKFALPKLLSPKLDGVRCMVIDGVAYSRNLKPIRNRYVQSTLGKKKHNGSDGELIVGSPTGTGVFNRTQSGVMSADGEPDFTFFVFDNFARPALRFSERLANARELCAAAVGLTYLTHHVVLGQGALDCMETDYVTAGYEGVMLRCPDAAYKYGRATPREDSLWKLKRFIDGEATVTGLEEAEENTNVAQQDELGRAKRTSHKAGKVPKGMVGTILATDCNTGDKMRLGPGVMTHKERVEYWNHPHGLVGAVVKYKAFDYGVKDKLRFALYQGIRHADDR